MEGYGPEAFEESLDFGVQNMSKRELTAFHRYKRQPIGPWRLVKGEKGWDVVADRDIP